MWTEIIADTLLQSGHLVEYRFHNHKRTGDRLALLGSHLMPKLLKGCVQNLRHDLTNRLCNNKLSGKSRQTFQLA